MITTSEEWPSGPVRLTWIPHPLPYPKPITGVHCFCFDREDLVLVDVVGRGFGIPGGHPEPGESGVDCLKRELLEEASVTIHTPACLGAIQVDHRAHRSFDRGSQYPDVASLLIYGCSTDEVHPFERRLETRARAMIPPHQVSHQCEGWNDVLQAAFERALAWHRET